LKVIGSLKIDLPQMTNEKEVSAIVTIVTEEAATLSHPLRSFQISIPFYPTPDFRKLLEGVNALTSNFTIAKPI
jgi:hypothetical protein